MYGKYVYTLHDKIYVLCVWNTICAYGMICVRISDYTYLWVYFQRVGLLTSIYVCTDYIMCLSVCLRMGINYNDKHTYSISSTDTKPSAKV